VSRNSKFEYIDLVHQRLWLKVLIYVGVWLAIGLTVTTMVYVSLSPGSATGWWNILSGQLKVWYSLAIMTAVVLGVKSFFSSEKTSRWKRFVILAVASIVFVFLFTGLNLVADFAGRGIEWQAYWAKNQSTTQKSLIWNFVLYWLIWIIVSFVYFYKLYRKRTLNAAALELEKTQLEKKLTEARLHNLKAQLHPHFFVQFPECRRRVGAKRREKINSQIVSNIWQSPTPYD